MKAIQKHTLITPAQLYCLAKKNCMNSVEATDPRITPLRRYGSNALAYSTLQPGLEYFFDQGGYVAFKRFGTVRPSIHVLGDPIAEDKKSILRKFALQYPGALFCQISEETAQFLAELGGFFINICGVERVINVQEFCLDGKKMADMRRFRNVCQKAGVHVFESSPEGYAASMQAITREWLASKPVANRELAFLARPMVYDREFDVRYLFASVENTIVAYIIYDPVYEYGSIVGYHAVTQRARTNVPKGTLDFINMHFIELLKRERERRFHLGFSPFAGIEAGPFRESSFTKHLFKMFYERGNTFYGFKNLEFHKERYRAEKRRVYSACTSRIPVGKLIDGFRLCGVLNARTIFPFLWSLAR